MSKDLNGRVFIESNKSEINTVMSSTVSLWKTFILTVFAVVFRLDPKRCYRHLKSEKWSHRWTGGIDSWAASQLIRQRQTSDRENILYLDTAIMIFSLKNIRSQKNSGITFQSCYSFCSGASLVGVQNVFLKALYQQI